MSSTESQGAAASTVTTTEAGPGLLDQVLDRGIEGPLSTSLAAGLALRPGERLAVTVARLIPSKRVELAIEAVRAQAGGVQRGGAGPAGQIDEGGAGPSGNRGDHLGGDGCDEFGDGLIPSDGPRRHAATVCLR